MTRSVTHLIAETGQSSAYIMQCHGRTSLATFMYADDLTRKPPLHEHANDLSYKALKALKAATILFMQKCITGIQSHSYHAVGTLWIPHNDCISVRCYI